MIIDAHTHIINQHGGNRNLKPEDLVASLKKTGIDYAIVLANMLPNQGDIGVGGISNEQAVEIGQDFPQLRPVARISITEVERDLKQVEVYFERGLIHGLKFYPGYQDFSPADERLSRVYELCQTMKKPVMYHTGVLLKGSKGSLRQSHPLNVDDVANRFPELKIIMAHTGNPWILDAAAVVAKQPNVYVDVSGYFTEWQPISEEAADDFIKKFTEFGLFVGDFKKVLFGTDYPLYDQGEYLEVAKRLPLTDEEKDLVFWKNAKELFGL